MTLALTRVIRSRPRAAAAVAVLAVLAAAAAGLYGYGLRRWEGARALVEAGRPAEARADLDWCLAVWPRSAAVHLLAARAARLAGDVPAAEAHLKQCLKLRNGSGEDARLEFLLLRAQTGEDAVGPDLLRLVDAGHPQSPLILETLVRLHVQRVRYVPALNLAERWIKLAPDSARAYFYRGWVREKLDNPGDALQDYYQALELDPDHAGARLRVAEMLLEQNRTQQARTHLERLLQSAPAADRPRVLARLGQCELLQGHPRQARQLLEAAVQDLPDDGLLLLYLGKLEIQDEAPAKGEAWLRRALQKDPMDTEAQFNLAYSLQVQGRNDEAAALRERYAKQMAVLQRTRELLKDRSNVPGKEPAAATEVGGVLLGMGYEQQGLFWLEQALLRDPNYQPAHRVLADFYEQKGDRQRAATHRNRLTEPGK